MGGPLDREVHLHAVEIDCARRDVQGRVTHVGGPDREGGRWTARLEDVVAAVERDGARYFVACGAQQLGLHARNGELVAMVEDGWSVRSLPSCRAAS